ncbi:MAG: hypothetical protein QM785_08955 [Pyrinomonadaceae bacterium]
MDQFKADIAPSKLISALRGFNLLPAIVFLPTRRKCDEAASEVALDKSQKTEPERQAKRQQIFDEFAAEFPEVHDHKHAKVIVNAGVAAHHAGHIPSWKLLIERHDVGRSVKCSVRDIDRRSWRRFPCSHGGHYKCRHTRQ